VHLAKGVERGGVSDVVSGDGEHGIEVAYEVEDELGLQNGAIDVTERVGEGLDTLAVVGDRGVPLSRSVELIAKVDCACLLVVVEEVGDHDVDGTGSLIVIIHGEGVDRVIDRGLGPPFDGVVGLFPHRISGTHRDNRVEEGEDSKLPDHGLEEGATAGEVRPIELNGDRCKIHDNSRSCVDG
jgi:hypothetical protein